MTVGPKMVRGRILGILWKHYPEAITSELLYFALDEMEFDTPWDRLKAHLRYLGEREYVAIDEGFSATANTEYHRVRLTAKGKALVEGDIEPDEWCDPRGYAAKGQPV